MEEVTYYELFHSICMKMVRDVATTKLKLSYVPQADPKRRPSFISNDVDVFGYLMACPNDKCGSILHVEVMEDVIQNQECEQVLREDLGNEACVNDGMISLYGEKPSEYGLVNNDDCVSHDDAFVNVDDSDRYKYNQLIYVE
ncbi:hypothetical protein V5N11_005988 [Cardamine amara subsp. amara]|uniref:MULE transposase N-terminal all-beta domain-containing protein n=1 Tax=Cardamine amara subsp. amara TaxID=228776 RepID=A0ABD1BT37_CARAN